MEGNEHSSMAGGVRAGAVSQGEGPTIYSDTEASPNDWNKSVKRYSRPALKAEPDRCGQDDSQKVPAVTTATGQPEGNSKEVDT